MTTPSPVPRRGRSGVLALLLALALALATAVPGAAHDTLTDSSPEEGASGQAPAEVVLSFSGDLSTVGAAVEVTGPDGVVSEGDPQVDGSTVAQLLAPDLPAGGYAVQWRVTSSDGHPISGEYAFTVAEPAGADTGGDAPTSTETPGVTGEEPAATGADDAATGADDAATDDDPAATTAPPAEGDADGSGDGTGSPDDPTGVPWWGWALIVAAVIGLGALVARVVRSSR